MKPQHRFQSEREIMAAIFTVQRTITAKRKEVEELERQGHEEVRTGNSGLIASGKFKLENAERLNKNLSKNQEVKLKKLKEALSEFKTELLPGMGGDRAVVLRNLR